MTEGDQPDISLAALASGPLDLWVEWLKGSVKAYFAENSVADRLDAFAPFDVDPLSAGPAGDIAKQFRKLGRAASKVAPKAVVEILRTWSVGREGTEGALLLVELAIQLGSLNLFPVLLKLLDQADQLSKQTRHDLAFLAAMAAEQDSLKRTEIAGLLRRVGRMDFDSAWVIADLAVAFTMGSTENLLRLPVDLLDMLPDLVNSDHLRISADALATKLRARFQVEDLSLALSPCPDDPLDAVLFRAELYNKCVFPFERADAGDSPAIDAETEREFERRLSDSTAVSLQKRAAPVDDDKGSPT